MPKISRPERPLADVNVIPRPDGSAEVVISFMPDPDLVFGEGETRAFLALDASLSMKKMYGLAGPFGGDPNWVQGVGRKLGSLLTSISRSGKVSSLYWAVSPDGGQIETIGEFDDAGWGSAGLNGPKKERWGRGTKLLPVVKFGYETLFKASVGTLGVIITDGIIEDEKDVVTYCLGIGKALAGKEPAPFKLVLIGIGEEVDEGQLERLDDMFEGTGVQYDLWSHGMVASMQNEEDILAVLYGELMSESTIVAPTGMVTTAGGATLVSFADGMPGKFRFVLPKGEKKFVVKAGGRDVLQDVSEAWLNP